MHFATLAYFLVARSAGVAALKKGLTLYLTIGIVAAILFAHQGLDASTVVAMVQRGVVRLLLLTVWAMASLPVARAIFATPETWFLRALPVSTLRVTIVLGAMLGVVELPWFILWLRGGGILHGLGAILTAMALHAHLAVGPRNDLDSALNALVLGVWLFPNQCAWVIIGALAAPRAIYVAWQRAPEIEPARGIPLRRLSPILALVSAYGTGLVRRHAAILIRALILVAFSMAWACLAIANNEAWRNDADLRARVLLAIWVPFGVFVAASPMRPLLEAEDRATWVLDTCAVDGRTRRLATALLIAGSTGILAAVAGGSVGTIWRCGALERLGLAARLGSLQMVLALFTDACVRYTTRADGRDSGLLIPMLLAVIALAEGVLALGN